MRATAREQVGVERSRTAHRRHPVPAPNFMPTAPDAAGRAAQSVEMLRVLAPR